MPDSFITSCLHFNRPGPKNTEALVAHAAARAKELKIKKVIIATCTGRTVKAALEPLAGMEIIAVSHVTGFSGPDVQELSEEARAEMISAGVKVITAAHAFGGIGRGVRTKLGSFQIDEIMAFTLRTLGQGVKVGIEMACMAADRGYVRTDEDVMTIAGTGRGADTALIVRPQPSANCLELKVREIVAKPWSP